MDDAHLIEGARAGDEQAFVRLVERYQGPLVRLARAYVPTDAVAEEAVQETWMGVVRGIDRFEGRSSFKTWLFRILVNRARSAGAREPRDIPLDQHGRSVPPERFDDRGAWAHPIEPWEQSDDRLVAASWSKSLVAALAQLPPRQREVVLLRDVEGLESGEVCDVLGITEGNQRVLLHRGRSRLRGTLENELTERGA
ncbi:MAG: sigma-70 family RNA polymerase sigma factor [Acidimicrobiales bacterium]